MIGTLDSQVIEKFKEFQKKTGKYSDLDIENVEFEREVLNNLIDIFDSQRVPLSTTERNKRKGKYPYYGASGIIDYIDDLYFSSKSFGKGIGIFCKFPCDNLGCDEFEIKPLSLLLDINSLR